MARGKKTFNIDSIKKVFDIKEFYPPQTEALPHVIDGKNVVLAVPTAAGKTIVAYIGMLQRLKEIGGKALYIVPLRAIAREKYEELKLFEQFGYRVGISTG